MKNLIVAQSGGPTTAINASLAGVISAAKESGMYDKIYGAIHGVRGIYEEKLIDLTDKAGDKDFLELLKCSPSCYLGSCRHKMPEASEDSKAYEQLLEIFDKYDIESVLYIGGNDSMDTVSKLSAYTREVGSPVLVGGVPKTIDNDLAITDHSPGFGSAAKYIATEMLEMSHDTSVYNLPCVTIVEIMGRNAGWLTAASALARNSYSTAPQLIYLPEVSFDMEAFISDISKLLETSSNVVVAVSEGIKDKDGNYISASTAVNDKFGHAQLSGAGKFLEAAVKQRLGIKCRSVELNIPQRCAAHIASATDLNESFELGRKAVEYINEGNTGFLPALLRDSDSPYKWHIEMTDITKIANEEKTVPLEWINEAHNNVTDDLITYALPLIQGEISVPYVDGLPKYTDISHLF